MEIVLSGVGDIFHCVALIIIGFSTDCTHVFMVGVVYTKQCNKTARTH